MKATLLIFSILVALYSTVVLLAYVSQRRLQYFPEALDPDGKGTRLLKPWQESNDNFLGYVYEPEKIVEVLIHFHGNGGAAIAHEWMAEIVRGHSVALVLAEYPGYGAKEGIPSEAKIFEAAEHIYNKAKERWQVPIRLSGESLGTAVATYLASRYPVTRIALISAFPSTVEVAKKVYWYLPVALLMKDRFESAQYLSQVQVPLYSIHASDDTMVAASMGKKLFDGYPGKEKKITLLKGYDHNTIPEGLLNDAEAKAFRDFLRD